MKLIVYITAAIGKNMLTMAQRGEDFESLLQVKIAYAACILNCKVLINAIIIARVIREVALLYSNALSKITVILTIDATTSYADLQTYCRHTHSFK